VASYSFDCKDQTAAAKGMAVVPLDDSRFVGTYCCCCYCKSKVPEVDLRGGIGPEAHQHHMVLALLNVPEPCGPELGLGQLALSACSRLQLAAVAGYLVQETD
jgi:hypothetical protein